MSDPTHALRHARLSAECIAARVREGHTEEAVELLEDLARYLDGEMARQAPGGPSAPDIGGLEPPTFVTGGYITRAGLVAVLDG